MFSVENIDLTPTECPLMFQCKWTDMETYQFELKQKIHKYIIVSNSRMFSLSKMFFTEKRMFFLGLALFDRLLLGGTFCSFSYQKNVYLANIFHFLKNNYCNGS